MHCQASHFQKRLMDLLLGIILLMPCMLITFALSILIILQDPGPIFFVQHRLGRGGKHFPIIKLRTMNTQSEAILEQHFLASPKARVAYELTGVIANDPRIVSRAAALARKYYLDELPQILNLLKGDMSLVGPRPLERWMAEHLMSSSELQLRGQLRPGITGLAQVKRRRKSDIGRRMVAFDLHYVRHGSFAMDTWILFKTIQTVLSGGGIETETSEVIFRKTIRDI